MPSADLLGNLGAQRSMATRRYLQATEQQASYLDKILERLEPSLWNRLKRTAKAGQWFQDTDQSCFLGLATIWKLQVDVHIDSKDFELCVMTCGGNFTGGRLYLPDLDLCLEYVPHFMCIPPMIDYLRYKELTSNSKANQSDVNELTKSVNKTIWAKVKKQRGL